MLNITDGTFSHVRASILKNGKRRWCMKKKYQMLAAAGVLSITCLCSAFSVSAESDIAGHWAQETVTKWFEAGKINGYEDGTLRPDSNMTRAEFAAHC